MKELRLNGVSIISGINSLDYLSKINGQRFFITTGNKAMFNNGTINRIENLLKNRNLEFYIHSGIKSNPTMSDVINGLEKMHIFKPDILVSVGGGSTIDASKVMALFYDYPELDIMKIRECTLPDKRKKLMHVAVPSTSGTATEVTRAAVINFEDEILKIGLKTDAFIPDVAILDPVITLSMPSHIVAETGFDAITHGVEAYINKNINDFTEVMARGAIEGLYKYLPLSYTKKDITSREKVHNYQCLAGCAFSNVGLGMSHGISHAVGGMFDYGHGLLNAIILPYVLEYNSRDEDVAIRLKYLAWLLGVDDFIVVLRQLARSMQLPCSFAELGIKMDDFSRDFNTLVLNSMKGSTRVNPVKITEEEIEVLLLRIYEGNYCRG